MAEKISINHENQMMIEKQNMDSSFNSYDYSNSNIQHQNRSINENTLPNNCIKKENDFSSNSSKKVGRFTAIRNWLKQSKWRKKDKLNNSSKNSTPVLSNKVNNDNNKSIKNINCKLFSLNLLQIFHNILLFY
jgi:hypothetical protein